MACFGEPVIDTSSDEALKESVQKIEKNLKGEELENFRVNIQYLEGEDYKKIAHGKTAKELDKIIAQDLKEFNIRLIKSYINDLNEKEANNHIINDNFKNLKITKSLIRDRNFYTLFIEVENKTPYSLGAIEFNGVISSPERKKVWLEKEFFHNFPRGVEPNEKASFEYSIPHEREIMGAIPKGYELKAEVIGVWSHENKKFYPAKLAKEDQKKLERYQNELTKLTSEAKIHQD